MYIRHMGTYIISIYFYIIIKLYILYTWYHMIQWWALASWCFCVSLDILCGWPRLTVGALDSPGLLLLWQPLSLPICFCFPGQSPAESRARRQQHRVLPLVIAEAWHQNKSGAVLTQIWEILWGICLRDSKGSCTEGKGQLWRGMASYSHPKAMTRRQLKRTRQVLKDIDTHMETMKLYETARQQEQCVTQLCFRLQQHDALHGAQLPTWPNLHTTNSSPAWLESLEH
jgi:hypothetical protein